MVPAVFAALCTPLTWLLGERAKNFLLAMAILNIAMPAGIHLSYREDVTAFGALGGFNITLTTIALAGLYLPLLVVYRRGVAVRFSRFSTPLALYTLFSGLSLLAAGDVTLGAYEVFLIVQLFLLHLYLVNALVSWGDALLIVRYLLIGLVAQALLMIALAAGLAQVALLNAETRVDDQNPSVLTRQINILGIKGRIDERMTGGSRVGGSVGAPNGAASYLTGVTTIALGVLLSSFRRPYKLLAGTGVAAGSVALVLTYSRGGWIAFMLMLTIIGFFGLRHTRYSWKLPVGVAVSIVLAVGFVFHDAIAARLTEDDNGAAISRVPLMKLAALIIEDHPLLGVGANNFPLAMESYVTRGFSGEFVYSVHNMYLLVLAETGPGSLLAFVWFLVAMIRQGMRCWHYQDPLISPLALSCVAVVAGEMLHMLVDLFRGASTVPLLCVISALLFALERLAAARCPAIGCAHGGGGNGLPLPPQWNVPRHRLPLFR